MRRYTGVPSRTVQTSGNHAISTGQSPRGNAASMLTGHPSRTADAADSLTPSVVRSLSFSMIQEMLGIVNQKETFSQSAWHGTPHDFREFLLEMIGTGEGAQAHGWGLYFAKAKKTAASYRGRLSSKNELEIVYDGKNQKNLQGISKQQFSFSICRGFVRRTILVSLLRPVSKIIPR